MEPSFVRPSETYRMDNSYKMDDIDNGEIIDDNYYSMQASRRPLTGDLATIFSTLKAYIGTGVLGIPFTFAQTGILASVGLMLILSFISIHTLILLVQSKLHLIKKGYNVTTFGDVAYQGLGKGGLFGKWLVNILLVFTQVGFCCIYLIFLRDTTIDIFGGKFNEVLAVSIWGVIVMCLSLIRTLKSLGPLATSATICLGSALLVILIASITTWVNPTGIQKGTTIKLADVANIPRMIGVACFAFEGIGFILPAQTAIKKKNHFFPIILGTIAVIAAVYTLFGTFSYLGFRGLIQSQIINCFSALPGAGWKVMRYIVIILLLFSICITYPMQLFVATDIMEENMFDHSDHSRKKWCLQSLFRIALVIFTAVIAQTVPKFNPMMNLIGSLGSAPLQYILPSLIYLCVFKGETNKLKFTLLMIYIIGGLGILGLGTFISLSDLITA